MTFESRPYQIDAVKSVIDRYHKGQRQLLLRLPTGAGKTVISALLIDQLHKLLTPKKILFLAHRREIIDQTAEKIGRQIGPSRVAVEQAERKADDAAAVVVASIQTLAGRLDAFAASDYGVVIVDECHHAYAKTWMDTIGHFGKEASTLLLGLTATPKRSDGRNIGELFGETAFEISLGELQDRGFLVPMNYYTIEASLGLGEMPLDQRGEFQSTLIGKIMNTAEMRSLTLRACLEKAKGLKTIAFCASVGHAQDLARDFEDSGIRAAAVTGLSAERDADIQAFRDGRIQVLTNYGVLTEGFDDPTIECVLLARPTTSPLVYSQCLGRGLRSHPGKDVCIVIDIVDRAHHQLQYNVFEAAGLSRSWKGSGKDPLREAEAIARIRVTDPDAFLKLRNALSLGDAQRILMNLDPKTVLAGIDGMPLVRYNTMPSNWDVPEDVILRNVSSILREAGCVCQSLEIKDGAIHAQILASKDPSPYLGWHLKEATGLGLSYSLLSPPEEPLVPTPPLTLAKPPLAPKPSLKGAIAMPSASEEKPAGKRLDLRERMELLKTESSRASQSAEANSRNPAQPKPGLVGGTKSLTPGNLSIHEKLKAMKKNHGPEETGV